MEEYSTFQKVLVLLAILTGTGLVVLIAYFVKKDRRTMPEKVLDRVKDFGSSLPGIDK